MLEDQIACPGTSDNNAPHWLLAGAFSQATPPALRENKKATVREKRPARKLSSPPSGFVSVIDLSKEIGKSRNQTYVYLQRFEIERWNSPDAQGFGPTVYFHRENFLHLYRSLLEEYRHERP